MKTLFIAATIVMATSAAQAEDFWREVPCCGGLLATAAEDVAKGDKFDSRPIDMGDACDLIGRWSTIRIIGESEEFGLLAEYRNFLRKWEDNEPYTEAQNARPCASEMLVWLKAEAKTWPRAKGENWPRVKREAKEISSRDARMKSEVERITGESVTTIPMD